METSHSTRPSPLQRRLAGWILAGSATLSMFTFAHHPVGRGRPSIEFLMQIAQFAAWDRVVHGFLIALMGGLTLGLIVFSIRLGLSSMAVIGALVAFVFGVETLTAAGVIDGFIVPGLAAHYVGEPPSEIRIGIDLLSAAGISIQAFAKIGLSAMSTAIFLWSIALISVQRLAARVAGGVGLAAAVASAVPLSVGGYIGPHLGLVVGAMQMIWCVLVGALLIAER